MGGEGTFPHGMCRHLCHCLIQEKDLYTSPFVEAFENYFDEALSLPILMVELPAVAFFVVNLS